MMSRSSTPARAEAVAPPGPWAVAGVAPRVQSRLGTLPDYQRHDPVAQPAVTDASPADHATEDRAVRDASHLKPRQRPQPGSSLALRHRGWALAPPVPSWSDFDGRRASTRPSPGREVSISAPRDCRRACAEASHAVWTHTWSNRDVHTCDRPLSDHVRPNHRRMRLEPNSDLSAA